MRLKSLLLLATSVIMLGAACGSGDRGAAPLTAGASAPRGAESGTLRLGIFPNITHATGLVGIEADIFARNLGPHVTLKTSTFNAGPAAVEALFSNALDAAYIGPNPAINAYVRSKGAAIRVVAGATSGGAFFVVQSDITNAGDLRGKKVASPQLGNTQDVALRRWLKEQGLRTDVRGGGDVSVVPGDNARSFESFRAGQIAGAWVPEPWATRLVTDAGGKVLVDERDEWPGGAYVTTHLVVRTAFLQQHPDVVELLLRGHVEATAYVNAQPAEARRLVNAALARITGRPLPDALIAAAWRNLVFTNDPLAASLRTSATEAAAFGFVDPRGIEIDGIYDLRLLNTVLRGAGNAEVQVR